MYEDLLENQIKKMRETVVLGFQEYDSLSVKESSIIAFRTAFTERESLYIREYGEIDFFLYFAAFGIMPVFKYDQETEEYDVIFYREAGVYL